MFDRKMFPSIGADDSLGCSSNAIHPVKLVGLHWGGIKKKKSCSSKYCSLWLILVISKCPCSEVCDTMIKLQSMH